MLYVLLGLPSGPLPSTSTIFTSWYLHCPLTAVTPSVVRRSIFLDWATTVCEKAKATTKAPAIDVIRIGMLPRRTSMSCYLWETVLTPADAGGDLLSALRVWRGPARPEAAVPLATMHRPDASIAPVAGTYGTAAPRPACRQLMRWRP